MDKELYKIHSEVCKVFSNPTRLELLDLLRGKGMSVSELMGKTELSQANVSQHLSIMKSKGILVYERRRKNVFYRIHNPKV
ncbi:MAG TPA: metalloregulator ArsR/SmtB family transcription factor, partial [Candidatus Micrarchaeota archaeon]|nr:metalloregulator ArsR/SmtB family transcription factor [Candidatus Micrarchaeota archaeon]